MKLYVITHNFLSPEVQAVQCGHAVAQWMMDNPNNEWKNNTLIYLTVPDAARLTMLFKKLVSRAERVSEFREPDLGNQRTAIAVFTNTNILRSINLLGA